MGLREGRKWELEQKTVIELLRILAKVGKTDGTILNHMEKAQIIEAILKLEFGE